jgi:HK97 family phage prohead protease
VVRKKFTAANGQEQEQTTLAGYAMLWNQNSSDRGGYVVRLAPNSALFAKPTLALFNHNFSQQLGTTDNGTLRILPADDTGIPVEIDLNMGTSTGRDVAAYIDRGDIKGMSFSMANGFEEYTEAKDGDTNVLTCSKFTVDEVTVTGIPAFTNTTIGKKNDDDEDEDEGYTRVTASHRQKMNRLHLCRPLR